MAGAIEPVEIDTGAGTVAVHVLGAGLPTVLWHGLPSDGSSWLYVLPALLPGRRLLIVDGPGWGRSGRLRHGADSAHVVDAARQVVQTLAPDAAVDWVGVGWGGRVGLQLTTRSPELVRSLVLAMADPAPMAADDRRRMRRMLRLLRIVGPVGTVGRSIVAEQLAADSRIEPQTVGSLLDALLLAGRVQAARSIERFEVRRPDLTGLLPGVAAPVLLLAGDADSPWPAGRASEVAALAPFAQVAEVRQARHQIPLDRPEAFTEAVRRFWAGLELPL